MVSDFLDGKPMRVGQAASYPTYVCDRHASCVASNEHSTDQALLKTRHRIFCSMMRKRGVDGGFQRHRGSWRGELAKPNHYRAVSL